MTGSIWRFTALATGGLAAALLAGCVTLADQTAACRTIFVYHPPSAGSAGGVTPVSSCGGLPREKLDSQLASAQAAPGVDTPPDADDVAPPDPVAMIERGDIDAFLALARSQFVAGRSPASWMYVAADELAAGRPEDARKVLTAMDANPAEAGAGRELVRPWVLAANGDRDGALAAFGTGAKPLDAVQRGRKALLLESLGDIEGALAVYATGPDEIEPVGEMSQPGALGRLVRFRDERLVALRRTDLLLATGRDVEAIALLEKLAAGEDDAYLGWRLDTARAGKARPTLRTPTEALALVMGDEAQKLLERQTLLAAVSRSRDEPPFNVYAAALRQLALRLDPDDAANRLALVQDLFAHGHFAAALRLSQEGEGAAEIRSELLMTAGRAALELGSPDALEALVKDAVALTPEPEQWLTAAQTLTSAGRTDAALALIDRVQASPEAADLKLRTLLARASAYNQAGQLDNAVAAAREAVAVEPDDDMKQFLASMLTRRAETRPEGLDILRSLFVRDADNPSSMNNLGYTLVESPATPAELDEGYKLLKAASRLSPDEPNLLDSLGWAYYQYGDFTQALRFIDLAVAAYAPFRHWEILDHRGDVLWRLGRQDEARASWEAAIAAHPPADILAEARAKIAGGLTTPAPQTREPPEAPLSRTQKSSEI